MVRNPSGEQWTIRADGQEAVVVEVGGGLRSWTAGGREMLGGYAVGEQCSSGRGQLLMPWPNRIRDGRYAFEGERFQLALSEPEHHNASHGLVRWALWQVLELSESSISVGYRLHPQQGWAWHLDLTARYDLDPTGLTVTTTAVNVGSGPAPFGYGAHPYLAIGDADLAALTLQLPASSWLQVDDRMLPTGLADVEGTAMDLREARLIGDTSLDTAFTDLARDDAGHWEVTLSGVPRESAVSLWGDRAFGWAQVFTGKAAAGGSGQRGVAVEPMTCPPDAFNSGDSLIVLAPGQTWSGRWGLRRYA